MDGQCVCVCGRSDGVGGGASRAHVRAIAGLTSQHVVELLTSRRRYSRGGDWHVAATATRMRDRRARVRLTFDHFDV